MKLSIIISLFGLLFQSELCFGSLTLIDSKSALSSASFQSPFWEYGAQNALNATFVDVSNLDYCNPIANTQGISKKYVLHFEKTAVSIIKQN